jgi:hypothetical protein
MCRKRPMAPEKNGGRSVLDRVPTLARGNDQKRRVRSAHYTGPGGGPGDAGPVFAVGFKEERGGASVAGIGPGPTGGARSTRVLWLRQSLSFLPEIRKKIRNFSLFFRDPSLLSDCSAGRSVVAAERPGAVTSSQPTERMGNIIKVRPTRPGRVSGFRENGKPEPGTIAGQGGHCGGRRGAAGRCVPEGTR